MIITDRCSVTTKLRPDGAPVIAVNDGVIRKVGTSRKLGRYDDAKHWYDKALADTQGTMEELAAGPRTVSVVGVYENIG